MTRLIRAVAEAAPDSTTQVRILPSGVPVEAADFELLPNAAPLVVLSGRRSGVVSTGPPSRRLAR